MGANCGCINEEKETELMIINESSSTKSRAIAPRKRPNWEEKFAEFLKNLPILRREIKVN